MRFLLFVRSHDMEETGLVANLTESTPPYKIRFAPTSRDLVFVL